MRLNNLCCNMHYLSLYLDAHAAQCPRKSGSATTVSDEDDHGHECAHVHCLHGDIDQSGE